MNRMLKYVKYSFNFHNIIIIYTALSCLWCLITDIIVLYVNWLYIIVTTRRLGSGVQVL